MHEMTMQQGLNGKARKLDHQSTQMGLSDLSEIVKSALSALRSLALQALAMEQDGCRLRAHLTDHRRFRALWSPDLGSQRQDCPFSGRGTL